MFELEDIYSRYLLVNKVPQLSIIILLVIFMMMIPSILFDVSCYTLVNISFITKYIQSFLFIILLYLIIKYDIFGLLYKTRLNATRLLLRKDSTLYIRYGNKMKSLGLLGESLNIDMLLSREFLRRNYYSDITYIESKPLLCSILNRNSTFKGMLCLYKIDDPNTVQRVLTFELICKVV